MALFLMSLRVGGWVVGGWAPPAARARCSTMTENVLKKCCVNEQSSCVVVKKSQKIFLFGHFGV